MEIRVNDKTYTIKYGIEATSKSGIFPKMAKLESEMTSGEAEFEKVDELALTIAEVLLIGLQNKHRNEFGYDYNTLDGKDEAFSKACDILDEYTIENDIFDLYNEMSEEMMKNGFLRSLFAKAKTAVEQTKEEKPKKKKLEVVAES